MKKILKIFYIIFCMLNFSVYAVENRIGFFSSWEIPCGIAMYTKHMAESFRKQNYQTFFYKHVDNYQYIYKAALSDKINFFVVQYEPALIFDSTAFFELMVDLKSQGIKIIGLIHDFYNFPEDFIEIVDLAIVHREVDLSWSNKIKYIPMGVPVANFLENKNNLRKKYGYLIDDVVLVSIGFPLHTKQIDRVLEELSSFLKQNSNVKIQLLHSLTPRAAEACEVEYKKIEQVIQKNNLQLQVFLNKHFMSQEEFIERIYISDLGYQWFSHNSNATSASIKEYICARTPFIIPDSTHFHDAPQVGNIKTKHDLDSFINEVKIKVFDKCWISKGQEQLEKYYMKMNYDVMITKYIELFKALV